VDALFPEARQVQRRRRLRYAVLVLLLPLVASALLFGVLRGGDGRGRLPPSPASRPSASGPGLATVGLPVAGHFSSLAVVGRRLLLLGGGPGALPLSGYQTALVRGRATGTCQAAVVDPRTLRIGPVASANCGNPSLYGEHVRPIAYFAPGRSDAGTGTIVVRIARSDPAARAGYTLGPVVTTYPECSDCQAAWIYGDGSLWLYNPFGFGPRQRGPGALLRISTSTGAVLERWRLPEIIRTLLAVNADGLWLSPSIESGTPGRLSPAQSVPYESLYRISPGDPSPQRVLTEPGGDARWLLASGDTAAAAIDTGHGYSTIWTFTGLRRRDHGLALNDAGAGTELGTGAPTVVGNSKMGFYNVVFGRGAEDVIQVKGDSRLERTLVTVRAPGVPDYQAAASATLDGSVFFLGPPTNQSQSSDELHRITPH
jgi:hypothetical protein